MSEHSLRSTLKGEEYSYDHGEISHDDTVIHFVRLQNVEHMFVDTIAKYADSKQLAYIPGRKTNTIWSLLSGKLKRVGFF